MLPKTLDQCSECYKLSVWLCLFYFLGLKMLSEDLKHAVERCSLERKWTYIIGKVSMENKWKCLKVIWKYIFFGCSLDSNRVIVYTLDDRYDSSDRPPRHRSHAGGFLMENDFDPGCTRTLFVGNIEKTTTFSDLKEAFERYGEIVVSLKWSMWILLLLVVSVVIDRNVVGKLGLRLTVAS